LRLSPVLIGDSFALVSAAFGLVHGEGTFHPWDGWRRNPARPAIASYPEDNPQSAKKSQLGATLFCGLALSGRRVVSCARRHPAGLARADSLPRSVGDQHQAMTTGEDPGRGRLFPSSVALRYASKTSTPRDVAIRAPCMHGGFRATLGAVIDLPDQDGIARPSRSRGIKPLGLVPAKKSDPVSFLETLTGDPRQAARPLPPH